MGSGPSNAMPGADMDARGLRDYLYRHIPVSQAMGVEVSKVSPEQVSLTAPLALNINHRETAFGGSQCVLAILAAWSVVFLGLRAEGLEGRIVIHAQNMNFTRAVAGDFTAVAKAPGSEAWQRLRTAVKRRRMARITVDAVVRYAGVQAGTFCGEFVVLPPSGGDG
jgi:thioesterase domain-containing protein